ncbi:FAD-dependent oxidoreductase [Halovulum sp. GXIMD14793]
MRIAIAGCGIGGLAAAGFLARTGHEVTIYERFDRPRPVGSGLVIQPVGQAVLDALGAGQAARKLGTPITRMLGHEVDNGRTVLDVSYTRPGRPRFGLAMHRAALFQVLHDQAMHAGVPIQTGCDITSADNGRLNLADGRTEGPFDLIIDALGASSPLRRNPGQALSYGAIWGTIDWSEKLGLAPDLLQQRYRRADHMLGILPIGRMPGSPGQKAAIFWSLPVNTYPTWRATPLDHWKSQAQTLWPEFATCLSQITDHNQMTLARYAHGTLKRPYADRLVHIGDAAHLASPQLGQGANMALLDAAALAEALSALPLPEALPRYVALRRWHVRLYQTMSWAFTPMYQSDSRTLPILRDHILTPISRIPPIPGILSRLVCGELGWAGSKAARVR